MGTQQIQPHLIGTYLNYRYPTLWLHLNCRPTTAKPALRVALQSSASLFGRHGVFTVINLLQAYGKLRTDLLYYCGCGTGMDLPDLC